MRSTSGLAAGSILLLWCIAITYAAGQELHDRKVLLGRDASAQLVDYYMAGTSSSRAGLPEVRLWFKKSQADILKSSGTGWNYPTNPRPEVMNYPSWRFWQFSVTDALLQMIFEQATDPQNRAAKLGMYFTKLPISGSSCWSETATPPAGLVIDLGDEMPLNESFRSDRYVTYGSSYQLFFNGSARFLLTVHRDRSVKVKLISTTFPKMSTISLSKSLADLSGHPVFSFPGANKNLDEIQVVAEFVITRQPGVLKHSS